MSAGPNAIIIAPGPQNAKQPAKYPQLNFISSIRGHVNVRRASRIVVNGNMPPRTIASARHFLRAYQPTASNIVSRVLSPEEEAPAGRKEEAQTAHSEKHHGMSAQRAFIKKQQASALEVALTQARGEEWPARA